MNLLLLNLLAYQSLLMRSVAVSESGIMCGRMSDGRIRIQIVYQHPIL